MGFSEGLKYGGGGALAGGAVGGVPGAIAGGAGGFLLGLFDNREEDAQEDSERANRRMQGQFGAAANRYAAYRSQAPEARMAALRNRLSAYAGIQETLSQIYPGTKRVDINQLLQPLPLPKVGGQPMPNPAAPQPAPMPSAWSQNAYKGPDSVFGPAGYGAANPPRDEYGQVGAIRGGGQLPPVMSPRPSPRAGNRSVVRGGYNF